MIGSASTTHATCGRLLVCSCMYCGQSSFLGQLKSDCQGQLETLHPEDGAHLKLKEGSTRVPVEGKHRGCSLLLCRRHAALLALSRLQYGDAHLLQPAPQIQQQTTDASNLHICQCPMTCQSHQDQFSIRIFVSPNLKGGVAQEHGSAMPTSHFMHQWLVGWWVQRGLAPSPHPPASNRFLTLAAFTTSMCRRSNDVKAVK